MAPKNRLTLVSLMALGMAMPALAQQAPAAAAPQEGDRMSRDVVVVTASKREETVQDIAVAVTAITDELRDEIGLTTVQDYTNFAPGLSYSTANDRLGMRGVTRTSNNFGIRSGISNYVDGVYFSSAIPASREPIFVDRVEVVRGPQGTLYGRDSIGGALNVLSKRPSSDFEGQFNIGYGNFDSSKVETRFSGPITDTLRYSLAASRTLQQEGYLTNASGLESEAGRNDGYYFEGQLEGEIGDRFEWWTRLARLQWSRVGSPGARTSAGNTAIYDTRFFAATSDIAPNAFYGLLDPTRVQVGNQVTNPTITDRYKFNTDFTNVAHLRPTEEAVIEAVWHADEFDIKYLGGYVSYNYNLQQDHDGSPIKSAKLGARTINLERVSDYNENRTWFSNEINLISTGDGPFQWVMGAYQYQENYNQTVFVSQLANPGGSVLALGDLQAGRFTNPLAILPSGTGRSSYSGSPIPGASLVFHTNNQAVNNAYGVFLQTDYEFNDQWKVTGGLRWSKDISDGREYARIVNHYVLQAALAPLFGPAAALLPARIDVTRNLGGVDPATGKVGKGVINATVTNPLGIYYDAVTGNGYRDLYASWEEVTGVVGIDWTPDTDTLIYGKYNRGYKPGGLGAAEVFGVLLPTPYTDQEIVDAFELGLKREWPTLDLTTNVVAFLYDYAGYQVSNLVNPEEPTTPGAVRPLPYTAYVNLPKTQTSGFEIETIWRPTDNFRVLFNYGWTNPEIKESPALIHSLDPFALDPLAKKLGAAASNGLQGQSLAGNLLPFSPKNKLALNGTYTWDLEDGATIDASASYFWQDVAYSSIFNRPYSEIPAWDQTDARLTWTNSDGNIQIIGFVRNLFDEIVYDSFGSGLVEGTKKNVAPQRCDISAATTPTPGAIRAESCYASSETLRPPRTYGVELQLRF